MRAASDIAHMADLVTEIANGASINFRKNIVYNFKDRYRDYLQLRLKKRLTFRFVGRHRAMNLFKISSTLFMTEFGAQIHLGWLPLFPQTQGKGSIISAPAEFATKSTDFITDMV